MQFTQFTEHLVQHHFVSSQNCPKKRVNLINKCILNRDSSAFEAERLWNTLHFRALIEREGQEEPVRLDLQDNGAAADQIFNDGIYSRYFTRYDGTDGRYTLRCQVKGDDETEFVTQKSGVKSVTAKPSRSYPLDPMGGGSAVCCGSSIGENVETESTGNFTRKTNGNSFKVNNAANAGDFLPPSKVSNLKAYADGEVVEIKFTAPGEDLDYGNATLYDIRFSTDFKELTNATLWANLTVIDENNVINNETLVPIEAGEEVLIRVKPETFEMDQIYYLAMKAVDKSDNISPLSNIAQVFRRTPDEDSGLSGGAIAGIVIGSALGAFLFVMLGYFAYKRMWN